MNDPIVSIVMPAFNAAEFIGQALRSALAEGAVPVEVLVVDDASTDATVDVVRQCQDPRVRLLVSEANRGPSAARNRALEQARGEWIAFLDADDWWAPGRLSHLLAAAQQHQADMVGDNMLLVAAGQSIPWADYFQERGVRLKRPTVVDLPQFMALEVGMQPLIRRSLLTASGLRFDESLHHGEDSLLYTECLLAGARLVLLPEAYYYYRRNPDSLTTKRAEAYNQGLQTAERLLEDPRLNRDPRIVAVLRRRIARCQRLSAKERLLALLRERRMVPVWAHLLAHPALLPMALGSIVQRVLRGLRPRRHFDLRR